MRICTWTKYAFTKAFVNAYFVHIHYTYSHVCLRFLYTTVLLITIYVDISFMFV